MLLENLCQLYSDTVYVAIVVSFWSTVEDLPEVSPEVSKLLWNTVIHSNFIKHQLSFCLCFVLQAGCDLGNTAAGLFLSDFSCSYL